MSQQPSLANQSIDINLLVKEYEGVITQLMSENIRFKALLKQIQLREDQKATHPAPPAAPGIPEEVLAG